MEVVDNPRDENDTVEIKPWNNLRNPQFPEWPTTMVVIKDSSLPNNNDFSIFPPINHENLPLPSRYSEEQQDRFSPPPSLSSPSASSSSSSSLSSFSPSDSDQSDTDSPLAAPDSPDKRTAGVSNWWLGIVVEALRSRALRFASSFGGNGVVWWTASGGFVSGAGILVAVIVWSLWIRARQRRRIESLVSVVKEKDEKINRLLHQIAQLNEVLIARHKLLASKVPN